MHSLVNYDNFQFHEEMIEIQALCMEMQQDISDMEYMSISKKKEYIRIWRMV